MAETPGRFFYAGGGIHLQPYAETITWLLLRGMSSGGINGKGRKGEGTQKRKRKGGGGREGILGDKIAERYQGGYKAGRGGREGKQGESTIARR